MCGIAGIFGKQDYTTPTLDKMLDIIVHRGPDDAGTFAHEQFAFGMRRLSIIDLSGGHQPIWNEDKTALIIFNGEIYNYLELHEDLIKKGHIFGTKSDTETILHLYEEDVRNNPSPDAMSSMLRKLRGMFAFAIYDFKNGKMLIARDLFGIKPLYYRTDGTETFPKIVSFGSEIKSLLEDVNYKREVNHRAIHNYLSFQYNPLDETCFKGIFKLKPGSFMDIDVSTRAFSIGNFWKYEFAPADKMRTDEAALAEDIFKTMKDSVEHHMISDVPVGAFLSGGIDSAVTVTLMQKERERLGLDAVKTFTIGFEEVNEQVQAREVSDSLKTDHHEIKVSFDEYLKELPTIAWHFDEPVADPSAVALYFLAREARKHVKVVLSGEGSDELFGGYNIYREPFALAKVARLPSWIKSLFIKPLVAQPVPFFGKNYLRRALTSFNDRYMGNAYIFKTHEAKRLWKNSSELSPLIFDEIKNEHELPGIELAKTIPGFDSMSESRRMQLVDMNYWLVGDILAKADKMTMAHSLELRVPYLDIEVAALSETISDELKYKNGKTKYALRKAFESILPKTTAERKKLGFPTPIKHWLAKDPEEIMRIIVNNKYISNNFNLEYINTLAQDHIRGKSDNSRKIYILLMLALWYNQYID